MVRRLTRRSFLALSMTSAGVIASYKWPKPAGAVSHPYDLLSIQSGDVTATSAVLWGRGDRESRLVVDFSTSSTFKKQVHTQVGSLVSAETDYTGTIDLQSLHPDTTYYYQVRFINGTVKPWNGKLQKLTGRFRTAPTNEQARSVRFVWAAAIYYDPSRAAFKDFNPFWEFVIGPIHAGAFGPAADLPLDPSFGPEYEFKIFPEEPNLPPPNNQFFGSIDIDEQTAQLSARIHDITGKVVYEKVLSPA